MSTVAQSVLQSETSLRRKTSVRTFLKENMFALNILSIVFVVIMSIVYIAQVNSGIAKGYQIRDLETSINELSLTNQRMEISTQKSQSLEHVSRAIKMLGFVEAEIPEYVTFSEPSYALAD